MLLLHGATTYAGQGWYHLTPPYGGPGNVRTDAPLREWIQQEAYDTAKACEAGKLELINHIIKKVKKDSDTYAQVLRGICIASDDPRLSK